MESAPNEGAEQTRPILYAAEEDQGIRLELNTQLMFLSPLIKFRSFINKEIPMEL